MFSIPELKLNKFQPAEIPSGKELFERFGAMPGKSYSGDTIIPQHMSKIDAIKTVDNLDRSAYAAESAPAPTEEPAPSPKEDPKSEE